MAEQRMKAREKTIQKMTKDGLVEENLADKSTVRVSSRTTDVQMKNKDSGKGLHPGCPWKNRKQGVGN